MSLISAPSCLNFDPPVLSVAEFVSIGWVSRGFAKPATMANLILLSAICGLL